jgi:hypothetical protein
MFDLEGVGALTDMMQSLFMWIFILLLVLGLALGPRYIRSRERQRLYEVMRTAYDKGQPVPPELIASLTEEKTDAPTLGAARPGADRDLRRAIVLMAVGLGLGGLGFGFGYGISFASRVGGAVVGGIIAGTGAIPAFIGLAYLILYMARPRAPRV